jgi:hypothetical protein
MMLNLGQLICGKNMIVNFITFKWGKKYGPEYVNRLYKTLVNTYSGNFIFHCITDNPVGFDEGIVNIKMNTIIPPTKVFTMQKMFVLNERFPIKGNKCILDLDILIHNDLYPYFEGYNFKKVKKSNIFNADCYAIINWFDVAEQHKYIQDSPYCMATIY